MRLCKWAGLGWAGPDRGVWAAGAAQAALEPHPSWPWDGGSAPALHRLPGPGAHTVHGLGPATCCGPWLLFC